MTPGFEARCVEKRLEPGGVMVFGLQTPPSARNCDLRPGRHVIVACAAAQGSLEDRCYSIIRRPSSDIFEVAVKRTNNRRVADHLHDSLEQGSLLSIKGTGGRVMVDAMLHHRQIVMLAGGIGLTLPIALLRELARLARTKNSAPEVTLCLCNPTLAGIPFLHELLELDLCNDWFKLQIFVTRDHFHKRSSHFVSGRPTAEDLRAYGQPDAVVICGSHGFASGMREAAARAFVAAEFYVEAFSPPVINAQGQGLIASGDGKTGTGLSLSIMGRRFAADPGKSVLEHFDAHAILIRSQCRSGICGSCRIKILSGECRHEPDFVLTDVQRADGHALACCTYPKTGEIVLALYNP